MEKFQKKHFKDNFYKIFWDIRHVGSLLVGMGRRVVMLQVVGVGRCCGGLNYLGVCIGKRLNLTWLKLRNLGWKMDRQTCCNCTYKLTLLRTNENQCWVGAFSVFSYMRDCLLKHKKKVLKNLTEMLMLHYRSDVAEWTWRWYCSGYGLVSNVVTALERRIWKIYKLRVWWAVTYVVLGVMRKSGIVEEGPGSGRV